MEDLALKVCHLSLSSVKKSRKSLISSGFSGIPPVGGAIFESLPALKVYILMFEIAVKLPEKLLVAAQNRGEIGVSQEGTLGVPSCPHFLDFARQSVHFHRQDWGTPEGSPYALKV